ncbi:MAG: ATP-binding protein [Candidatus Aminicenantes bacterium]|nr:ATP-binding protein [Candidatus Aminicenantes bacterium]NIM78047.1 ATP-binding protein [Candidatus Aminicenantes bacterium]NIN17364.1 ATP-binding protein [Candidatus Aminicenantes bacterium]NIN41257.1 ATP-binding protein [Candidatus Aminicenantes bacterium]NIN84030.1 ATP-binding protein [Candidatus Aminicenantes bacterium]
MSIERYRSENIRSEIPRKKKVNPFKFGSIVDEPYFTNRREELKRVRSILESQVHLILMSPRRYGKSSLIRKILKEINRPSIILDMQVVTSEVDFAEQLMKKICKLNPLQKIKNSIRSFRFTPTISINPVSDELNVSFDASKAADLILEDVLNLSDKIFTKKRPIVVFDEFQEVRKISAHFETRLRSILQHHTNTNYVFLGSQESLIRDIFEQKNNPFYHFGYLFKLSKIPKSEFQLFLEDRLKPISGSFVEIAENILTFTDGHPYYTQRLAFQVWENFISSSEFKDPVLTAVEQIVEFHDVDYERWWGSLNRTDMKVMVGLTFSDDLPMSKEFFQQFNLGSSSTVHSSLKRLLKDGYVVRIKDHYEIDDPFFKHWIFQRRQA